LIVNWPAMVSNITSNRCLAPSDPSKFWTRAGPIGLRPARVILTLLLKRLVYRRAAHPRLPVPKPLDGPSDPPVVSFPPRQASTFEQIRAVTQTVKTIGGFARFHELLGLVKEVGGLRKMKELLEAMSLPEMDRIPF
jgi:hypothetical protein